MGATNEISPAKRARLQQCFEYGNQKMQIGDHDYATEMFAQCVCGDPSNILYMQAFIANLRVKYKNKRKKEAWSLVGTGVLLGIAILAYLFQIIAISLQRFARDC